MKKRRNAVLGLSPKPRKLPYTVQVKTSGGWWAAICPELVVSGFGGSKRKAIEAVTISIRSSLNSMVAMLRRDSGNVSRIAEIIEA